MCIMSRTHYGRCKHAIDRFLAPCSKDAEVALACPKKEYRDKYIEGSFGVGQLCPACETGKRLAGEQWVEV